MAEEGGRPPYLLRYPAHRWTALLSVRLDGLLEVSRRSRHWIEADHQAALRVHGPGLDTSRWMVKGPR